MSDGTFVILVSVGGLAVILLIIGLVINYSSRREKIIPDDVKQKVIEARPQMPENIQSSSSQSINIIIIILLVIMGIFWLIIGFTQFGLARVAAELDPTTSQMSYYLSGLWNIVISIINLWLINGVVKRRKIVVRDLTFLGIVGSVWGGYQLIVSGSLIQACAIPLYIILAILVQINKHEYINP
ncbi:MAG: hypothetical protein ACYC3H_01710 [Bellilinea sp.]